MTQDNSSRPAAKSRNSFGNPQPAMKQKSIASFFTRPVATNAPVPAKVASPSNAAASSTSSASPFTPTKELRTPVNSTSSFDLFSTDPVVLQTPQRPAALTKRKLMEDSDDDTMLSPVRKGGDDTPMTKKFAMEVSKLSLGTPATKLILPTISDHESDDEDDVPIMRRRPTRVGARRVKYQISDEESDDLDKETKAKPQRKQSTKKATSDDDDGSDYEAPKTAEPEEDDFMDIDEVELGDDLLAEDEHAPVPKPVKRPVKAPTSASTSAPTSNSTFQSAFNKLKPATTATPASSRTSLFLKDDKKRERSAKFAETNKGRYEWLLDIRDADQNPIGSPNYDPRTLYIPKSAWNEFSEFESQFWKIKGQHFDAVVFFKKGKFYELYEGDADIGSQQFDLKMTDRTNMRMAGVPESSFEYWAAQFIAKGYKVARVDQMETALAKSMRERGGAVSKNSAPKVIQRELHSILTAGTLTDSGLLTNDMATYCMAIKEWSHTGGDHLPARFGVVFVDTSTAEFNLATFRDDMDRTKFETLITQIKPKEVVLEKGGLSARSLRILKNSLGSTAIWNYLQPETQFWGEIQTKDEIRIQAYFGEDKPGTVASEQWPAALQSMEHNGLVMSAMGGLVWYLRSLKLDKELMSFKNFQVYDPVKQASTLILDGQTLSNLEIFQNTTDGSEEGTLLRLLNRCVTPFGKRLFRRWLCHPLRSRSAISARLDAVEDMMRVPGFLEMFDERCSRLPDLERIVSRIHAGSCKINEFLVVLSAFKSLVSTSEKLSSFSSQFQSQKLPSVLAELPDLKDHLQYFDDAFDHRVAAEEGNIVPRPGFAEDYDEINDIMQTLDSEFAEHLEDAKKKLKCTKVIYKDLGKEIYQLEVPNKVSVPNDWRKMSGTNAVSRYYNPKLTALVTRLQEAKETKGGILRQLQSRLYAQFDIHYKEWLKAVKIIAELDCLGSLCKSSSALGSPSCRPEFVEDHPDQGSVLELESVRHPCVIPGIATDFIPNDTTLGGQEPNLILLTGPNMGGKSTLLRQTCIAVIMAQLGCFVPAEKCRMSTFDRIFTRIGANDNILAGQSTFMVELSETSKILSEATERSIVILDELGRGTSTYDGYAIAYSVLHELSTQIGSLGLFSTHYGTLTEEFERDPNVALKHMACQVDQDHREVTFLYKLVPGVCEKSYGMNVAHMAGVPRKIVDRAEAKASAFEVKQEKKRLEEQLTIGQQDDRVQGRAKAKQLRLGSIVDLAYLLSRLNKPERVATAVDQGDGVSVDQEQPDAQERETRIMRRILQGMVNI